MTLKYLLTESLCQTKFISGDETSVKKWDHHCKRVLLIEVPPDGQQRAPSYQAKDLQEEEMVEEQDASGKQRPPHVSQRLRLVHTCKKKKLHVKKITKQKQTFNGR